MPQNHDIIPQSRKARSKNAGTYRKYQIAQPVNSTDILFALARFIQRHFTKFLFVNEQYLFLFKVPFAVIGNRNNNNSIIRDYNEPASLQLVR